MQGSLRSQSCNNSFVAQVFRPANSSRTKVLRYENKKQAGGHHCQPAIEKGV